MAKGKKTFVLHTDLIEVVMGNNKHDVEIPEMTDEEAGQLLKWMLQYVNDMHPIVPRNIVYAVAFVKKQLDAELEAYKAQCQINSENGKKGGRPKKTEKTEVVFEKPKKADTDTDTETDNDILDKLDKLDKQYTHDTSMLQQSINKQKKHIDANGLDWIVYINLDYDIRPYYYNMKLDHIQSEAINDVYKKMKSEKDYDFEIMHKVFFYTLDKILKSEFKADNFIGYFKSVFQKNYKFYEKGVNRIGY